MEAKSFEVICAIIYNCLDAFPRLVRIYQGMMGPGPGPLFPARPESTTGPEQSEHVFTFTTTPRHGGCLCNDVNKNGSKSGSAGNVGLGLGWLSLRCL